MKQYWVEGVYIPSLRTPNENSSAKNTKKSGAAEPFLKPFWAESEQEALSAAQDVLCGGWWINPPKVTTQSEEERMRSLGAPELPGLKF